MFMISLDSFVKDPIWMKSHDHIKNFTNKWLHKVDLRPIVVTNKLYSMNKQHEDLAATADNMIIQHSGIQITLMNKDKEMESYLLFPHYTHMIADLLLNTEYSHLPHKSRMRITQSLTGYAKTEDYLDGSPFIPLYKHDHGYIQDAFAILEEGINIVMSCDKIWDKLLFQDNEFMAKSILPQDVLHIICDDYIGDVPHNKLVSYNISQPLLSISGKEYSRDGKIEKNYDWICHKLTDDNSEENIVFNTAIKILGKYFTLETILDVSCYDMYSNQNRSTHDIYGKFY